MTARVLIAAVAASLAGGLGGWEQRAPLPAGRAEVAATVLRGEIVVVGGYLADGSTSPAVTAYSPEQNRWRSFPDLPIAVNHGMAAAFKGKLYVAGGYDAVGQAQRSAFVLDGGSWRALAPMPEARAAGGAAVVGTKLYVVGGVATIGNVGRRLATRTQVLDLMRLRWSTIAGPTPREHLAVTALGGRVYALAGRLGGIDTNLRVFEAYKPGSGWRQVPPIPRARGGTAAAALNGRIVSAGGEEPAGTIASVYAYDVSRARWTSLPDLPTARHGLGLAAIGGRVYAVAGGTVPGLSVSAANETLAVG